MQCVQNLLNVLRTHPCLYMDSKNPTTFEWVNRGDDDRNIVAYYRRNPWNYDGAVLVVCNFSPVEYHDYTVGVPMEGFTSASSPPTTACPARPTLRGLAASRR